MTGLVLGIFWIGISDLHSLPVTSSALHLSRVHTAEGLGFLVVVIAFAALLARKAFRRQRAGEREQIAVFHESVKGANHLLRNYITELKLVTLEIDGSKSIPSVARNLSAETEAELRALASIESVSVAALEESIENEPLSTNPR